MRSAVLPPAARLLLVAALYVLTAVVSMSPAVLDGTTVPVWLPAGVAFVAVGRFGLRVWPGLWIGAFFANLIGVAGPEGAAIAATGATLAGIGGLLLWRRLVPEEALERLPQVPALGIAALVASVASAVIGNAGLLLEGAIEGHDALRLGAIWAMGDAFGILLVVPAWLLRHRLDRAGVVRFTISGLALALLAVLVFADAGVPNWLPAGPAIFLAVRHGLPGGVLASAVITVTGVWATDAGVGPFAGHGDAMLEAQLFALAGTAALLSIAVLIEERDRVLAAARRLAAEDAALRRVATAVAGTGSLEQISHLAAGELTDLLGLDSGVVVRYDGDTVEVLARVTRDGLPHPGPEPGTLLSIPPGGAVDRVRRTARPERFDERGGALSLPPFTQRVAAPVVCEGAVWGALITVSAGHEPLPADTEERLGRFAELVGIAITNVAARDRLLGQATTDPLTGLVNHRSFHERLREEVALARRHRHPLSVVVFDIDRFKHVNDAFGHLVGDRVLSEAARRLRAAAREGELVARIGGDELAVLMPGTRAADALVAAERLRGEISATAFAEAGPLTISAGVCDLREAESAEDLLRLADGALYWGKAHGRDQAVRYLPDIVQELSAAERAERLERTQALAAVRALAGAIDAKDPATTRHSERVADLAARLAEVAGWPYARVARLRDAGLVHDVGKIGVPDAVLSKPGRLTDEEYTIIKRHAELGARIAGEVLDAEQVAWVRGHHERHDGRGYPDGLAGEDISDGARIMALADAWDAMTGARVYSAPMPPEDALAECRRQAGRQFAPEAVAALEVLAAGGTLGVPLPAQAKAA